MSIQMYKTYSPKNRSLSYYYTYRDDVIGTLLDITKRPIVIILLPISYRVLYYNIIQITVEVYVTLLILM